LIGIQWKTITACRKKKNWFLIGQKWRFTAAMFSPKGAYTHLRFSFRCCGT